jgi:TolA-binding protein
MRHVLAMALLLVGTLPAMAQMDSREGIALQNEILALRQQVQALQDQMARGAAGAPPSPYGYQRGGPVPLTPAPGASGDIAAELLDRVSRLEDQVRSLQGRVDELGNQVQTQGADLNKQISDLNFRLGNGGGPPAAAPPAPSAPPPASPPPQRQGQAAPPSHRPPELALQEGNAALARRDYPAAAAAAREVLATNHGPRATDAQFLLSEAEAGTRNYQQAAVDYYDAYNRSRTGGHAADALLGVATSLTALNDKPAACQALDKLRAEFPDPRPDLRSRAAAARKSAGCR